MDGSASLLSARPPQRPRLRQLLRLSYGKLASSVTILALEDVYGGLVPLSLRSRQVGEIAVVACRGRIVEGPESEALQEQLTKLLRHSPDIVLDLGEVDYIDSSGLGLLVRLLGRAHNAQGSLKLCALTAKVAQVLSVTRLSPVFGSYESVDEAVAAFYQGTTSSDTPDRFDVDILCVEHSADVLAFVREVLKQAGYGVMTATNVADALILLKATRPKVVVIGADLRSLRHTDAAETFNRLADALFVVELPPDFSSLDAGEAGRRLLDQIGAVAGAGK